MRFRFQIDSTWTVTVTCDELGDAWKHTPHKLGKVEAPKSGFFPVPLALAEMPTTDPLCTLCAAGGQQISQVYSKIIERRPDIGDVEQFGHYLFDALIGPTLWQQIEQAASEAKAKYIELALSLPSSERDLYRLNWEMMRGPAGFLAAGSGGRSVVVTRLIEGAPQKAEQLRSPPRILFVVGTAINNPTIRPAAEYLGLLRQLKRQGRGIYPRLLEKATLRQIRETIRTFHPDVVHFICHGGINRQDLKGYLELETEEQGADKRFYAEQLLPDLRVDGKLPAIVVLSACYTASVETGNGRRDVIRMMGAHETAPLAAELVKGGVPVVLAMAGRVSDRACRLFTRRFGEAMVQGEALVEAIAEARRATFVETAPPRYSVDWAFPAVFMASGVDPGYKPVQVAQDDSAMKLANLITGYKVERQPVFWGREDFFQAYYELFEGHGPRVLVAYVIESTPGFGRTRLLEELTIQALRDGHLPILVRLNQNTDPPATAAQLIGPLFRETLRVRTIVGLNPPASSQLNLLMGPLQEAKASPELDAFIRFELESGSITARAVSLALRRDLAALAADYRSTCPAEEAPSRKVIVLVDKVDRYGQQALEGLFDEMLDGFGLGDKTEPVPVVLTLSLNGQNHDYLHRLVEQGQSKTWLKLRPLKAFQPDGEDLLAYEHVWLNPFNPTLWAASSSKAWAINDESDDSTRTKWINRFRKRLKGIPSEVVSEEAYVLVDFAAEDSFLIEADDEHLLQKVRLQR